MEKKKLILASASPRRKALLEKAGFELIIEKADLVETLKEKESGKKAVLRLSKEKAKTVEKKLSKRGTLPYPLLSADTLVLYKKQILGKPRNREEAKKMLQMLSGRWHSVVTGCFLIEPNEKTHSFVAVSKVRFHKIEEKRIEEVLDFNEWEDAAGAYKIQGKSIALVKKQKGSLDNIIGLPTEKVLEILSRL